MDRATRHGQAQPKGNIRFLALLGEKRLAQEQDHKQETQRKKNLPGHVKTAHLQRSLQ